jgi:cobalt-zinc-cadmium resistance protein CzcA
MSGLLYISEIDARRRVPDTPLLDAVIRGARAQVRPRLILIVVAGSGMLPAALAGGIGSDIQRPLATAIVGGLWMEFLMRDPITSFWGDFQDFFRISSGFLQVPLRFL